MMRHISNQNGFTIIKKRQIESDRTPARMGDLILFEVTYNTLEFRKAKILVV